MYKLTPLGAHLIFITLLHLSIFKFFCSHYTYSMRLRLLA